MSATDRTEDVGHERPIMTEYVQKVAILMGDGAHRTTAAWNGIIALRQLPLGVRMELMNMEPVGLAHQTCPIECVHYGEVTDGAS